MNEEIKILVVDDHNDNLITMRALVLESFPYAKIYTALSGKDGIDIAKTTDIDVILLDILMPEMDGFEVCSLLKKDPDTSDIPVVFVTALKADKANRIKGIEVGGDAFLSKPIDESELLAQLRAMLKIRRANVQKSFENERLANLVAERTKELEEINLATLNLLEDLKKENEARRLTEYALSKSESLYRSILQASPDCIVLADTAGKILMASDSGLKLLDVSDFDQVIGKNVFDFLKPDEIENARKNYQKLFEQNKLGPVETKIRQANNLYVDIEINAQLVLTDRKEVLGMVFIIRDITNRKKEQEKLQQSEALYRGILDASPDNIVITDVNGNIQFLSPAALKTLEYDSVEYLQNKCVFDVILSPDRDKMKSDFYLLMEGIYDYSKEYKIRNQSGIFIDIEVKGGIIRDFAGEITQLVFIARDVTERKITEAALEASEAKYRELLDNSPEGITIYVDGKIVYVNKEAVSLMRAQNKNELIGLELYQFISRSNMEIVKERMKHVAMAPMYLSLPAVEEEYTRLDGTTFTVEIKAMRIVFEGKDAVQLVGRDVTDRKIAEYKILKSEEEFRTVWENSTSGLKLTDEHGNIVRINKAFCKIFETCENGLENNSIIDLYDSEIAHVELLKHIQRFNNKEIERSEEREIKLWNGTSKWVHVESTFLNIKNEKPLLLCIFTDVTQRKLAEDKVRYVSRLYALLGQINQAIVRTHDEQELLKKICDVAVEYGGFKFAWIGKYNQLVDTITPIHWAGDSEDYIDAIIDVINDPSVNYSPTRNAMQDGVAFFSNDISNDETMYEWRKNALKKGYLSTSVIPLRIKNRVYGNLNLYATESHFFNDEEKKLIFEIADDINHALNAIDAEFTRKLAEEALLESENRYNTFINNNVDMIYVKDEQLRYLVVNNALAAYFGLSKDDILNRTDSEIETTGNDVSSNLSDLKALSSDVPVSVQERLGNRIFETTKFRMKLRNGHYGVGGILHDVTERMKYQDALEESRAELKTIYDSAPVMMCMLDKDGSILFSNDEFTEFVDLTQDEISHRYIGDVLSCYQSLLNRSGCGNGRLCNQCNLRNAIETVYIENVGLKNIEYHSKLFIGGVEKDVYLLGSTSLIYSGGEKKILLCLYDITSRKEAEKALQKSEMFLRTFIDNAPFQIWARDKNNVGILENKMLVDNFGSILGRKPTQIPELDPLVASEWERTNNEVMNGGYINQEVEFIIKGHLINYHQMIFPIVINDESVGVAGFDIDITERRKVQKALEDSQKQLKHFAGHIQNVREEERVLLAREIHDDLGQILVALKIDIGMLGMKAKNYVKEESAEDFKNQFQRITGVVDNTIQTARRIMNNLRPEVLDLLGLVEVVKTYLTSFEERYEIHCVFITNIKKIELDGQKTVALYRIMQEALNNVAKHSLASEVIVTLMLVVDKNEISLEVKDNGIGFNANKPHKADSYGLIGMKERAYILDGSFDIISSKGKGTTILMNIKLSDNDVYEIEDIDVE